MIEKTKTMIKIQKTSKDGKICEFWELTDEDRAKMKAQLKTALGLS